MRLLAAYEKVDAHFRSLFRTLFDGGQAHLELVESDDPLEAGLEIMAQPPGKRLSALTLLSGYQTPDGLRRIGVTRLAAWLRKRGCRNSASVARAAVDSLHADFDPARDELEPSLELALRRLKGSIIPPGSWNRDALPPHLLMSFQVVDANGRILDEDDA